MSSALGTAYFPYASGWAGKMKSCQVCLFTSGLNKGFMYVHINIFKLKTGQAFHVDAVLCILCQKGALQVVMDNRYRFCSS